MDTARILADLRSERERVDRAIVALEQLDGNVQPVKRPYTRHNVVRKAAPVHATPRSKPQAQRTMSAASRRRMSKIMKDRWAARKRAGANQL